MDGWVGTFWDLKHTGVTPDLDAILAQDQGRDLFFPTHPPLTPSAGPIGCGGLVGMSYTLHCRVVC